MPTPIAIAQHALDFDGPDVGLAASQVRRQIKNWAGWFRRSTGLWTAADETFAEDTSDPTEWTGTFEFRYRAENAAAQVYVYDRLHATNPCTMGLRLAQYPTRWLNMQLANAAPSGHTVFAQQKAIRFEDPLAGVSEFWWQARRNGIRKLLVCDRASWAGTWSVWLKMPEAATLQSDGEGGGWIVVGGDQVLRLAAAYAWDDGDRDGAFPGASVGSVSVAVGAQNVQNGYRFVRLDYTVDPVWLAAAGATVYVDPTATILYNAGTGIEDNAGGANVTTFNYGNSTLTLSGQNSSNDWTTWIRCPASEIPAGTIDAARFYMYRASNGASTLSGTIEFYAVKDANTWVEGTAVGSSQAGSSCWNFAKFNTQAWAGTAGCKTSGTDYDADASPPSIAYAAYTSGPDVLANVTLVAQWFTDWRDAARTNNGFVIRHPLASDGYYYARSAENGSNQPYFEVDYSAGPAGGARYYRDIITHRRRN